MHVFHYAPWSLANIQNRQLKCKIAKLFHFQAIDYSYNWGIYVEYSGHIYLTIFRAISNLSENEA